MKPPNIVTVHFLSAKWSKKLFTINHYELQNGKCIVTQELSAYYTNDIIPNPTVNMLRLLLLLEVNNSANAITTPNTETAQIA